MVSTIPFRDSNAIYAGSPCHVPGCAGVRTGIGRWCQYHAGRNNTLGHPQQHSYLPKDYALERSLVEELVKANLGHPGIASALELFRSALIHAEDGTGDLPSRKVWVSLVEQKADPLDLLIEAASVFVFSRWNAHKFHSDKAVRYAVARSIIRKAKSLNTYRNSVTGKTWKKAVVGSVVSPLADYIVGTLGVLFLNITSTLESREDQRNKNLEDMNAPFLN